MSSRSPLLAVVALALVVLLASTASAEERRSGTVKSIDPAARTLVLEEIGPWTGEAQGLRTRTIVLAPGTDAVLVARADANAPHIPPGEWPGGFRESSIDISRIQPGDFVTVVVAKEGTREVARRVSVVDTAAEAAASPGTSDQPATSPPAGPGR